MRVVLDTNVLVSALINAASPNAALYAAWKARRFELVTCEQQLEEFSRVTRYPRIRERITPAEAGAMKNEIRHLSLFVDQVPKAERSPDPADNVLLAMAEAARADYLVSGDKQHVLRLKRHGMTRIVSPREMAAVLAG